MKYFSREGKSEEQNGKLSTCKKGCQIRIIRGRVNKTCRPLVEGEMMKKKSSSSEKVEQGLGSSINDVIFVYFNNAHACHDF